MNSCEPISMTGTPASLWKCGTTLSAMVVHPGMAMKGGAIRAAALEMPRNIPVVLVDSHSPGPSFAHVNSTQSCRPREALLSSGTLRRNSGTLSKVEDGRGNVGGISRQDSGMKRRRISLALAGIVVSCAVGAALWPHAREALVLLSSQDEPAD